MIAPATTLRIRDRVIGFPRRPLVMAIVNVNDDSFSNDGTLNPKEALAQAEAALFAGADIVDFGAESARTNRQAITEEEEVERLRPVLQGWSILLQKTGPKPFDEEQLWPPLLSVNTWRPGVAEPVLELGVDLLNDIGALPDDRNARLCADHGASLLIMHSVGEPKIPHRGRRYDDVISAMERFFEEKLTQTGAAGLSAEHVILDPGIDFAKDRDDNLRVYRELECFHRFGRPLLLPVSRKTVIGDVLGIENPADRDAGTLACTTAGLLRGAQIFRVHDVASTAQAVKVLWGFFAP